MSQHSDSPKTARSEFESAASNGFVRRARAKPKRPFTIRLSDDERLILVQEAGKLSLSTHVRQKLLGDSASCRRGKGPSRKQHVPLADQIALGKTLALLGRSELSRSLRDIAAAAVMGTLPITPELVSELQAACGHVHVMRDSLMEALGVGARTNHDSRR